MDNLGLRKGIVELFDYDNDYTRIYLEEKKNLERLLKDKYIRIEHVGSTAIKNIKSKPIIDILVTCKDLLEFQKFVKENVESETYTLKELQEGAQDFLIRKEEDGKVKAFIHVVLDDSKVAKDYILFRDFLNNYPEEAKKYEELKVELLKKYKDDRPKYTEGKNEYIKNIIKKAEQEKRI
ncbi:MAG: GrpB family protein [Clostridia bacterium]|nr:GrpB family protein [Clostridia bacterium]